MTNRLRLPLCLCGSLLIALGCSNSVESPDPGDHGPRAKPTDRDHPAHGDPSTSGTKKPAAPADKAPRFLTVDRKNKTVEVLLIATYTDANYGMNFNGYSHGKAVYTIPVGWRVNVQFKNASPVPHSVVVVEQTALEQLQIGDPYFDGASTPDPTAATTPKQAKFSFVAEEAGDFAFACGFPTHAAHGHWLSLMISADAPTATLKMPKDATVETSSHHHHGS